MRELVFSVGITFLTGTLLFVYFRNKISNIDRKVNLVFETIQEHNNRIQVEAQEEMKRFQMFHEQQMQMAQQQHNPHTGQHSDEPTEQMRNEPNNLIDVSDQESDLSDMSEEESSDDDNSDDDTNNNDDVEENPEVVTLSDNNDKQSDNNLNDLLNGGITEVNVENIHPIEDNVKLNDEEDVVDSLKIMEEKLSSKTSDTLVNYNKYTKAQLRNICEEKGFTGWKSLNKGKLVTFLENQ